MSFKRIFLLSSLILLIINPLSIQSQVNFSEVEEIISRYYGEWNDSNYPGLITSRVPNTALTGNGDVGVVSGGDMDTKTFYISKGDFWTYQGSPVPIGGITIRKNATEEDLGTSLALNAAVTASASHPNFPPSRMVNGQWMLGYEGWVSDVNTAAATNPFWVELDLGSIKTFNQIVLRHDAAARPQEMANVTSNFTISVRNTTTQDWKIVATETGNVLPISKIALEEEVSAQYVRLEITKATQETTDDSRYNPRARIGQFELYLNKNLDETPQPVNHSLHEVQDMLNAEIRTDFESGDAVLKMKTFTSAVQNLLVIALTSESEKTIELDVNLWPKADNVNFPVSSATKPDYITVSRSTPNNYRSNSLSHTSKASMSSKIIGSDFTTKLNAKDGSASMIFSIEPAQTVYIITAIEGGGRTYDYQGRLLSSDPVAKSIETLSAVTDENTVSTLLENHRNWWKEYWSASYIKLDPSDAKMNTLMKYYYAAQYALACNIREGKVAPGLYGLWHTSDNPNWNSDYHLNYNFISTFYGVNSSNRVWQGLPAIDVIQQYKQAGIKNASTISELRKVKSDFVNAKIAKGDIDATKGISDAVLYPVGIGPWGMTLDFSYHNEALNAAFSAYPMIEYYNYTQDEVFLRDVMYDYLKKCVNFYEAWLEYENGKYVLYAGYNEGSWAINPAVELSVLKSALKNLIQASTTLGLDEDKRSHWKNMLDNLAAQPTATYQNKKVYSLAEQEWLNNAWQAMTNPVPGDGNIIPMESVIPGEQVGYYSPQEELDIAKNTIDIFSGRGAWGQINNFPKIYPIAVNTRYPVATIVNQFASTINNQIKNNLMIEDGTHGIEKAGAIEA
ncbi:MAG: discoidin domain-containing protein, partial [Bacteroidales bacterium]|nr:discoidin domain-containing protein [Bacteroidales bacterium]